jgi:HNH endonuclease
MDVEKAAEFYEDNYDLIGEWYLKPNEKVVLHDATPDVCRFCGESTPTVTFNDLAHAVPESLGNKSLSTDYECDSCNNKFGKGIENDFGNWSMPMRTIARIKGKNGVPTIKKGPKGWSLEYERKKGLIATQYENDPIFTIDEANKSIHFKLKRMSYTPVAVLKAFVKMALSVMPETEMPNFKIALQWINNPDHTIGLVDSFPVPYTFIPGPLPNDLVVLRVHRKKEGVENVLYAFMILQYANEMFQVFIPSPENDAKLPQPVTIHHYPTPYDLDPNWKYGKIGRTTIDLTGRAVVKNDFASIRCGFDAITDTTAQKA